MKILKTFLLTILLAAMTTAQTKVVPIIDMKVGGLIGGVENGRFLDAKTTLEKLSAEQKYMLYPLGRKSENLLLKKPTASSEICDDFFGIETGENFEAMHNKGGVALGEGFRWNPQPRAVTSIPLNNAANKKIIQDLLRTKGITLPVLKLDQAYRADLDGDGREEVILTATRVIRNAEDRPRRKMDAYSVVLIRKIVNGKPQNIILDSEFVPKSDAFYDGYTYEVSAIADLNGDGKMEVVLHSEYSEGSSTSVFEVNGKKATAIENLNAGCGL